jgi:hypothetical protein
MSAVAQAPSSPCLAGTQQVFAATGTVQTYSVPAGSIDLLIVANGGAGGATGFSTAIVFSTGGHGSHISAGFAASGLTILDVVVGGAGQMSATAAGGGGGSFVYTPSSSLLVAAGGGGGGAFFSNGLDAELGTAGATGVGPGGLGGNNGSGGGGGSYLPAQGGNGGGGGGFLGAGGDGAGPVSGSGGHRVSPPGDAAGASVLTAGGFGGGGGAGEDSGGGGGGYSGGGGGAVDAAGGGGGSFVGAGGAPLGASILATGGDGSVSICMTQAQVAIVPALDPGGLVLLALVLGALGCLWARRVRARRS